MFVDQAIIHIIITYKTFVSMACWPESSLSETLYIILVRSSLKVFCLLWVKYIFVYCLVMKLLKEWYLCSYSFPADCSTECHVCCRDVWRWCGIISVMVDRVALRLVIQHTCTWWYFFSIIKLTAITDYIYFQHQEQIFSGV